MSHGNNIRYTQKKYYAAVNTRNNNIDLMSMLAWRLGSQHVLQWCAGDDRRAENVIDKNPVLRPSTRRITITLFRVL